MTKQPRRDRPVERGSERSAGAPTSTEKDTSRRPSGTTSGSTSRADRIMDEHDFMRQKELNPDDFE